MTVKTCCVGSVVRSAAVKRGLALLGICALSIAALALPHKGAVDCTIPFQSFSGPQGTFTLQGTATGFLTPR